MQFSRLRKEQVVIWSALSFPPQALLLICASKDLPTALENRVQFHRKHLFLQKFLHRWNSSVSFGDIQLNVICWPVSAFMSGPIFSASLHHSCGQHSGSQITSIYSAALQTQLPRGPLLPIAHQAYWVRWFLNLQHSKASWGTDCWNPSSESLKLRICMCNKFPDDVDAGLKAILGRLSL